MVSRSSEWREKLEKGNIAREQKRCQELQEIITELKDSEIYGGKAIQKTISYFERKLEKHMRLLENFTALERIRKEENNKKGRVQIQKVKLKYL